MGLFPLASASKVPAACRSTLRSLALLALLALPGTAGEPPGRFSFQTYGPEQGLRNQAVTSLGQDQAGFFFVGTEDGLFRYDGSRFQRFGVQDGLASDGVLLLYGAPDGKFWVATQKGLRAWAGDHPDPASALLVPDEEVTEVSASRAGHLVVATLRGVFEGDPARGLTPLAGAGLGKLTAAWVAPDGAEVLVAGERRLGRRDAQGVWTFRTLAPAFKGEDIQTLLRDAHGRIWLRGRQSLVRLADFSSPLEDLSAQVPGTAVQKGLLSADAQGRVWVPSTLGLVAFEGGTSWLVSEARGLPSQWVTTAFMDREGSLWAGSEGVHKLRGRLAWTLQNRNQGLPSDTVWTVYRSRDGVLWAGTTRGLARAMDQGWLALPGTRNRIFYAMAEDRRGALWAAGTTEPKTQINFLLRRAPGARAFTAIPLDSIPEPSTINSLAYGPDGILYLATLNHGIHRVLEQGGKFRSEPVVLPQGEAKEQVNQLVLDAQGRLWAASLKGLLCFDGQVWRRFTAAQGLREVQVEVVAPARSGGVWVSYWNTHAVSRFVLEAGAGRVAQELQGPPGLLEDNIYSMGEDTAGALWLGTAQGVKRWRNGMLERFGRGEGLPGEDAAANGFWPDANGDVWLGMANGLAHFQASLDSGLPAPPQARVLWAQDRTGRTLPLEGPGVAWRDRPLTFRFSGVSFANEAQVHCQVRLVGFEDGWRDTELRETRYTGLPPGRYRFEVRARYGTGPFGPASGQEVRVLAPWWRTGWFLTLALGAGAGLILLVFRWRLGWLRHRNAQLEALVRARTQDLETANLALQDASMVDPLTGLKNRRFLSLSMPEEQARVARQRREDRPGRVAGNRDLLFFMVDLDHFKQVNDTHGHGAGDLVLRQASARLRATCREADLVVRWGGEEFLIVARNSDRSFGAVLAQALLDGIRDEVFDLGNGLTLRKTCSVGFTAFPVLEGFMDAFSWEDAVELADQCLYAAKSSGRDAWVGVLAPDPVQAEQGRILHDLPGLVAEGKVEIRSSLPPGQALVWKEAAVPGRIQD